MRIGEAREKGGRKTRRRESGVDSELWKYIKSKLFTTGNT